MEQELEEFKRKNKQLESKLNAAEQKLKNFERTGPKIDQDRSVFDDDDDYPKSRPKMVKPGKNSIQDSALLSTLREELDKAKLLVTIYREQVGGRLEFDDLDTNNT